MGIIIKKDSNNVNAYAIRGKAYYKLGEHDVAVQHYKEGLKMDPEHKECKVGHKSTKSLLKKVKRGDEAMSGGKYLEAIEYFNDAISLDGDHHVFIQPTLLKISKAYTKLNDHEESVNTCNKAISMEESTDALFALSDAYTANEQFEEALRAVKRAAELRPEDQSIKQKIQKAEAALKQSKTKNYYKILGVSRNAEKKEIKKAYKEVSKVLE